MVELPYDEPFAKHAQNWNGNDVTLCGLANEAGDDRAVTGEAANPQYATEGERVTCPECMRAIHHVRRAYSESGRVKNVPKELKP